MNAFQDFAQTERRSLIDLTGAQPLSFADTLRLLAESRVAGRQMADRLMALQLRIDKAINWLDLGAPGRARDTLLEQ